MLTIFSIPKPFTGHNGTIQRNAIQSWLKLEPPCEIFLCGNDRGVAEAALEFNLKYIPDIKKNEYGTPLLNSAFGLVQQKAFNSLVCYVNADIILLNNVISAVKRIPFSRFLLLGQRWNLDIKDPIDYHDPLWEKELRVNLEEKGELQPPFGSDYFIFPKDIEWDLPEFAVGRPGWDNWFIYRARALKIPVIDATDGCTVIHQNHDYAHVPGGNAPGSYEGPEAVLNRQIMGGEEHSFVIGDATHRVECNTIIKAMDYRHLNYRLNRQPILNPPKGPLQKIQWRLFLALLYRSRYFPTWLWQNMIYYLTK
jgi:hypothetical protein